MAVFHTITSVFYPGFKLTQRGSHVVLEKEDIDNPYQLWYKDDSWRFTEDPAGNPAFALINNGSRAALKAADADGATVHVSLVTDYLRSEDNMLTTAWTLRQASSSSSSFGERTIFSVALQMPLRLGIGKSPPQSGDGVVAILGSSSISASADRGWTLDPFTPKAFILQSHWVQQILVAKAPHTNVTFTGSLGSFDNELGVVAVNTHANNRDGNQEVWYKVPAGSPLEDSNSSFLIISKKNGKALKGSTKPGDKVILTEFDPLDNNFIWSEDRSLSVDRDHLAINLANAGRILHWFLPLDNEYQNNAWNHPLTLRQQTTIATNSQWKFIAVSS